MVTGQPVSGGMRVAMRSLRITLHHSALAEVSAHKSIVSQSQYKALDIIKPTRLNEVSESVTT